MVASFTKAAAAELVGRDLPLDRDMIGTLHAHCYRQLGHPTIANDRKVIVDWNAKHPQWAITAQDQVTTIDDPLNEGEFAGDGDKLMNQMNIYRAKMIHENLWPSMAVRQFHSAWENWKRSQGVMDFTDLIEYCLKGTSSPPGEPRVLISDETQDDSKLEIALIRKWGASVKNLVLAYDDDQCQPEGSTVLTTHGYVNIEDLDSEKHRVVSYDRQATEIRGLREGYAFQKSQRIFNGNILNFKLGDTVVSSTPEHRWLARWSKTARIPDVHVVYMMRKGNRFRIGWCRLFRSDGTFHLGFRSHMEKADGSWIIRVCLDRTEASLWESLISVKYGIPTITFEEVHGATHLTREAIDELFRMIAYEGVNLLHNAERCLSDHKLKINLPIWTAQKAYERRGGSSLMTIESANIIKDLVELPVYQGKGTKNPKWTTVDDIQHVPYHGFVYSLDVEKYHLYITSDVVTHNSIYSFKGASPEALIDADIPPENIRVLNQSYRVPRAIQEYSQRWIKNVKHRREKEYKPRDFEGEIKRLNSATWRSPYAAIELAKKYMDNGKSVLFLTTCSYMLNPMKAELRASGIPFHNPLRRSRGDWNPLHPARGVSTVERLLSFMRLDEKVWGDQSRMWTVGDVKRWGDMLKADGVFQRGAKSRLADLEDDNEEMPASLMAELFTDQAFGAVFDCNTDWLYQHVLGQYRKTLEYPISVAKHTGWKGLKEQPKLAIGTVHSYKGGESDVVMICPDLSMQGYEEWESPGRDAIYRQFYVGFTRAKETLILCRGDSMRAVQM